ncbi:Ribosome-releasing factor 2, mitochondrial [Smittium mucronatum]|uniref:Ribosome-releasing factor 2, mitochondrial n=1 Tax=Smittium mucronatum TaxID=133383 RepID=A0A1R0H5G1_9FUNG|nr:Ribosome-releasing factor 2, mitochondrial [Smittium mucronatum]
MNLTKISIDREWAPTTFLWDMMMKARGSMFDILGELDGEFLEMYFSAAVDGNPELIPQEIIKSAIRRQTIDGSITPVFLGASFKNFGVQPVLDAVIDYLPSPKDTPDVFGVISSDSFVSEKESNPPNKNSSFNADRVKSDSFPQDNGLSIGSGQKCKVPLDPSSPLVAFVFKVVIDQQKGPMIFIKVYSGTLNNRAVVVNSSNFGIKERVTKLFQMYADVPEEIGQISCGNIGVVLGFKRTRTGDTILSTNHPSLSSYDLSKSKSNNNNDGNWDVLGNASFSNNMEIVDKSQIGMTLYGISIPPPVFFVSVEPETLSDEKHLNICLNNLLLEDPSLKVYSDSEGGQLLLCGMGELHLEIVKNRLVNEMKVNARIGKMQVSYRESIRDSAEIKKIYEKEIPGEKSYKVGMKMSVEPISEDYLPELISESLENSEYLRLDNDNFVSVDVDNSSGRSKETTVQKNVQNGDKNSKSKKSKNTKSVSSGESESTSEILKKTVLNALSAAIYQGPLINYPLTRLLIKVSEIDLFGFEPTHFSPVRLCTREVFKSVVDTANPVLFEPVMKVYISCPNSSVGVLVNELERVRRARIMELDDQSNGDVSGESFDIDFRNFFVSNPAGESAQNGYSKEELSVPNKEIIAQVPLSSMIGFSSALRRLTAGSGSFSMQISGVSPVDSNKQKVIIKEMRGY